MDQQLAPTSSESARLLSATVLQLVVLSFIIKRHRNVPSGPSDRECVNLARYPASTHTSLFPLCVAALHITKYFVVCSGWYQLV